MLFVKLQTIANMTTETREGYEIETAKHQALETISSSSRIAVLSVGLNQNPIRVKYNMMRELSEMPTIGTEDVEDIVVQEQYSPRDAFEDEFADEMMNFTQDDQDLYELEILNEEDDIDNFDDNESFDEDLM
jgi:hypothetical protein